jgi:hypothetical protein
VATNDVVFLASDEFAAHEARICISQGGLLDDARREKHYFNIGDRKQNIITCRLRNEASYHNGTGIGTKNADADKKNQRTGYVDICKRSFLCF